MGEWFEANATAEQIGGANYVLQLANSTPSAANIMAYVAIVREKAMLRQLIEVATDAVSDGFDPNGRSASEIVDEAVQRMMTLHRLQQSCEWTMKQSVQAAVKALAFASQNPGVLPGVPSGLKALDDQLGGLHKSDLIVIGARPAMGKTALMFNMARHAAMKGVPVGIISGEQSMQQLGQRMLALEANVAASHMRSASFDESEWPRITNGVVKLSGLPAWILDRSSPSIDELVRVVRRWKQQNNIQAVYVDYLQRIQGKGDSKVERVGQVAMSLKNLARDLDIPVVALAQVKREVEQRTDKRPHMADLSDSGEIEKEADQVLTLYRDDYYNHDSPDRGTVEILVEKNRHGATGFVRVAWLEKTMRFADLEYDQAA